MSDYSNARDKPGQKPYENLKIQVQFDKKTMRGPRSPDQFDPKDDNRPLGAHERSSFQQKDRSANPSYPKKETKLNEKVIMLYILFTFGDIMTVHRRNCITCYSIDRHWTSNRVKKRSRQLIHITHLSLLRTIYQIGSQCLKISNPCQTTSEV